MCIYVYFSRRLYTYSHVGPITFAGGKRKLTSRICCLTFALNIHKFSRNITFNIFCVKKGRVNNFAACRFDYIRNCRTYVYIEINIEFYYWNSTMYNKVIMYFFLIIHYIIQRFENVSYNYTSLLIEWSAKLKKTRVNYINYSFAKK